VNAINQNRELTIRRASSEDAALLTELGTRTFYETFAADNTPQDMAAYVRTAFNLARQTAELTDPDSIFLIGEVGGLAVGYAKLHAGQPARGVHGPNPVELVRLYVTQEWLGSGVGAGLMSACLDEALKLGHGSIWLGVWERNERAQAFYRKWNFQPVGEHMFQLGLDRQRDILMERVV
jgi:GNAT superfamily N-acetyltransferase